MTQKTHRPPGGIVKVPKTGLMHKASYIVAIILALAWLLAFIVLGIKDMRIHCLLLVAAGIIGTRLFRPGKNKYRLKNLRYITAILLIIVWGTSYVYLDITGFYIHFLLVFAILLIVYNIAKSKK